MQAGFAQLHIPHQNFFRMEAEKDIEEHARIYDQLIQEFVSSKCPELNRFLLKLKIQINFKIN